MRDTVVVLLLFAAAGVLLRGGSANGWFNGASVVGLLLAGAGLAVYLRGDDQR